jgi:IS605 OrfB family transposase
MTRAVKLSLKFCTATKRKKIYALVAEQRSAVNAYIPICHSGVGKLDAATKASYHGGHLSSRQQSAALNQALSVTKANRKRWGDKAELPRLKGAVTFSNTCKIEEGRGSFDLVVTLACLTNGKPIRVPTRGTKVLRHWLAQPGAKLTQGCAVGADHLVVWVSLPDLPSRKGTVGAVDIGINKVLTYTDGTRFEFIGVGFKRIAENVRRKRPGSNGCRRARKQRDEYLNRAVKALPWDTLGVLMVENLKHLKTGTRPNRSKQFRKQVTPWSYRQVLKRIEDTAEKNRVLLLSVNPAFSSQECPKCSTVSKLNRTGENFCCVSCGHTDDADVVGATNIRNRGHRQHEPREPTVPRLEKTCKGQS